MKKISFVVPKVYHPNRLFDINDPEISRDDSLKPLIALRSKLASYGIDISTQDINPVEEADLILFDNMPDVEDHNFKIVVRHNKKCYLLISELELIHKMNNDIQRHKDFIKIFTYQDRLVDNVKYFKFNYTYEIPPVIPKDLKQKNKLCVLIARNKTLNHPFELYSKRLEAIRWFERYHPQDFDLYGIGWDQSLIFQKFLLVCRLNDNQLIRKVLARRFPSYRGRIKRKDEVLLKYKFCICYENVCQVRGWITEKIFDCFLAGCVPIYWGAPNITDHIPPETFIDKRNFKAYEELYRYLKSMPDEEYRNYLNAIEGFVYGERFYLFSIKCFVDTFVKEILKDI